MANRVIRFKAAALADKKVLRALVEEDVEIRLVDHEGLVFEAGDSTGEEFPLLIPALRAGGFSYDHHGDGPKWGGDTGQWKTYRASTNQHQHHALGIETSTPALATEAR